MPINPLSNLSPRERSAYPIIQKGVTDGLSGNVIQRKLQDAGLGLRRSTVRDLVAAERNIQRVGTSFSNLPKDKPIDPSRLPTAITTIRREYSFTAKVSGYLVSSGKPFVQHVTVTSDKPMSPRQIEEEAAAAVQAGKGRYGMDIVKVTVGRGVRAGVAGTFS